MKRAEILACLKELNKKGLLSPIKNDGPTSMFVAINGKNRIVVMNITEAGTAVNLTIGRFFKRRYTISLYEIGDLR